MARQNCMKTADGRFSSHQRGVALIEAMIAMLVMAFGTLALVGVQATLRLNSDIAKQRAEATRIGLADLERARNFISVATVTGKSGVSWDEITNLVVAEVDQIDGVASTKFSLNRTVSVPASSLNQKNIHVVVSWNDRAGQAQSVTFDTVVAAADPTWSALLNVPSKPSAHAQRTGRYPTIPAIAQNIGGNRSAFKPIESGTVGWVFNNTTGLITSVCSGTVGATSSLTASSLGTCAAVSDTYFLTGFVNFNLRDAELNLLVTANSVFKPISGGTVAWLIDNSSRSITQRCAVSSGSTTATLAAGTDSLSCVGVSPAQLVSPVDSSLDKTVTLVASDSEAPLWPALNFDISFLDDSTKVGRIVSTSCFTTAPTTAAAANSQTSAIYYCAVKAEPDDTDFKLIGWGGQVNLSPAGYSDAGGVAWTIGTGRSNYKVCRYTTAATAYTDNVDHPLFYCKVRAPAKSGDPAICSRLVGTSLANQNFLVIAGSKSCPTDTALTPGGSDLVNSNTLQQQP